MLLSWWSPAASPCAGAVLASGLQQRRVPSDVEAEQGSGAQANPKPVAVCVLPEASPPSLPWEQPHLQPRFPSCVCWDGSSPQQRAALRWEMRAVMFTFLGMGQGEKMKRVGGKVL